MTALLVAICFLDWFSEPSISRHVWLARALVEDGSATISRFVDDPSGTADIARVVDAAGDRIVPGTYPGVSLALVPVAVLGRLSWDRLPAAGREFFLGSAGSWIVFLAVVLVAAPLLAFAAGNMSTFTRLAGLPSSSSRTWLLGFILGTPLIYYSARLHEAAPVVAINAVLLVLTGVRAERIVRRRAMAIGLCLGLLDLINPLAALVSGLAVLVISGWRSILLSVPWIALGLMGPEIVLRAYLWNVFGSPLASPYSFLVAEGIGSVWARRGAAGMVSEMIRVMPEIGWGLSFGIRGLFVFAPITLLALWVCIRRAAVDAYARAGLVALAVNTAVVWTFVHGVWAGGTSWGPRYLLPCLPWLFAGAVKAGPVRGLRFFVLVSIFVTALGLQFGPGENVWGHLWYFVLSGPTTPFARYASWMGETVWVPSKIASDMMNPSMSGQYFALTHISGIAPWLILVAGLWWAWRPRSSAG